MMTLNEIQQASKWIRGSVLHTPTIISTGLSEALGHQIILKLENLQKGGSFKPRGVLNKLFTLSNDEQKREMVAVSGGNFGIAMAEACKLLNTKVTIVLPESAPNTSAIKIKNAGAKVIWEPDVSAAYAKGNMLKLDGYLQIDDCDDLLIAAGSGTIALEMQEARPDLTDVFIAVGGGAMISGVATVFKALNPKLRVWGVESSGADSMSQAITSGFPVTINVTSLISTLGVPTIARPFFDHAKKLVHKMIVVNDQDAFNGVIELAEKAHIWAEPAAGTLVAAIRQVSNQLPENAIIGLVICGGNCTLSDITKHDKLKES